MNPMKKLTLHSLKRNRVRTVMTTAGIMLSAALITVVSCMAMGARQTYVQSEIKNNGDWTIGLTGRFDESTAKKIAKRADVQDIYEKTPVGMAEFASKSVYKPYISLIGWSENSYQNCFQSELSEGRFPTRDNELLLTPQFFDFSKKTYHTGDTITLQVGSRWKKGSVKQDKLPEKGTAQYDNAHIPDEMVFSTDSEELVPEFSKTYTVTGILKAANGELHPNASSPAVPLYTGVNYGGKGERTQNHIGTASLNLRLTDDNEDHYLQVLGELTGKDTGTVQHELQWGSEDSEEELAAQNAYGITEFRSNYMVLRAKGIGISDSSANVLYGLAAAIITIIVLSSIFIIRNSFAISITEKTKLYGILSSVGASPKQIRDNVLFEACILGAIGIPLGVGLGIGVTALLTFICSALLHDALGGQNLVLVISWIGVALTVVLSALTIFLSTFFIARRAARISPIEAIRSNKDVNNAQKSTEGSFKTPHWIEKRFGVGGAIAWKNLRRSRKKYRTTVISIVLSVTLFLSMYSFIGYALVFAGQYTKTMDNNLSVSFNGIETKCREAIGICEQIAEMNDVTSARYNLNCYGYYTYVKPEEIAEGSLPEQGESYLLSRVKENQKIVFSPGIMTSDESTFRDIVSHMRLDYDEVKDKGLIVNTGMTAEKETTLFRNPRGMQLTLYSDSKLKYNENGEVVNREEAEKNAQTIPLELAGSVAAEDIPEKYRDELHLSDGTILAGPDWIKQNMPDAYVGGNILLYSRNANQTEADISQAYSGKLTLYNAEREAQMMNSLTLVVQIFIYGFIIVISLIGMTNIFNTIATNMRLRSKEFAMLRSVGMTRREFNRMIRLESVLYSVRALVFGIPLGLLGGYLMKRIFDQKAPLPYQFPWLGILIAVAVVMAMVWIIMRYSISKVQKQNIIETIRNENI